MKIMPGAVELCKWLDVRGIPRGLITRNLKASVEHFHTHHLLPHLPFSPAIGRECGFAYKPSPEALLHICSIWGIAPTEAVFVGDSPKDDVSFSEYLSVQPDGSPAPSPSVCLSQSISSFVLSEYSLPQQSILWLVMIVGIVWRRLSAAEGRVL